MSHKPGDDQRVMCIFIKSGYKSQKSNCISNQRVSEYQIMSRQRICDENTEFHSSF